MDASSVSFVDRGGSLVCVEWKLVNNVLNVCRIRTHIEMGLMVPVELGVCPITLLSTGGAKKPKL